MGVNEQEMEELLEINYQSKYSRDSVGAVVYEDFISKFCLNCKN